ncbi:MAG: hypothetical protein U1E14_01410 [Geminicoccaceae bacterium]
MTQLAHADDSVLPAGLDAALQAALGRSGTGAPAELALTDLEKRKAEGLRGALIRRSGLSDREALDAIATIALATIKLERLDRLELDCLDRMGASVEAIIAERKTLAMLLRYRIRVTRERQEAFACLRQLRLEAEEAAQPEAGERAATDAPAAQPAARALNRHERRRLARLVRQAPAQASLQRGAG